jgi:WD40 repeat protein
MPEAPKLVSKASSVGVYSIAYSRDGSRIACGALRHVSLWDVDSFPSGKSINHEMLAGTLSVVFSPDGKRIAAAIQLIGIFIWDTTTNEIVKQYDDRILHINSIDYSPDGSRIIFGAAQSTLGVVDAVSGKLILSVITAGNIQSVAYSPDGTRIAICGPGLCQVLNATNGNQVAGQFRRAYEYPQSLSFSPDGKHILVAYNGQSFCAWDVATGQVTRMFTGHTERVGSVAYSPDGTHIISCAGDKTIRVWDASTGKTVANTHNVPINHVAYSPDGRHIAGGVVGGGLEFWIRESLLRPPNPTLIELNRADHTPMARTQPSLYQAAQMLLISLRNPSKMVCTPSSTETPGVMPASLSLRMALLYILSIAPTPQW